MNDPHSQLVVPSKSSTIGRLLLDNGKISAKDAARIMELQNRKNLRFGQAAIKLGLVSKQDIMQALAQQFDYPCLAPGESGLSAELTAAYTPFTPQAERLRELRSQLMLRWFDGGPKALAIVASEAGEGVSHLAANLAVSFAQLGERTLLIDANLREPRQHGIFNIAPGPGLSELLAGRAPIETTIIEIEELGGLAVMPGGAAPPNPSELLARSAFSNLLKHAYNNWSVVIVDTAPADAGADFQTVAARTRGALLVTRQDQSRVRQLARIREMLNTAGVKLLGAVVNQF
ncbi:MAG TPA: chain length determinant protein tyrosine kinase EpsG [Burkholderiales bacterium]|nr:chain length determinant protein tyrosine kinase EpsG [Burkholderiales bacterium]